MTHTILRQYLHLDLHGSEAEGFALQHRLPELCDQWLRPAMERVLDRCAPSAGRLCIERLEVDAGNIRLDHLERDLAEAVAVALEKAINELVPPGEASNHAHYEDGKGLTDSQLASNEFAVRDQSSSSQHHNARLKTDRQTALEAFVHFLENGRLPWSFRLPPGISLEAYLLDYWKKEPPGSSSISQIAQTLRSALARRRLVLQFSAAFLETLLPAISPQAHISVRQIRATLRTTGLSNATPSIVPVFEKRLWETAFAQAVIGGNTEAVALVASAVATVPETIATVLPALKDIVGPSLSRFVHLWREAAGADFAALAPPVAAHLQTVFGTLPPEVRTLLNIEESAWPTQPNPSKEKLASVHLADLSAPLTSIPEEGLYVDNAGLVILHPFLQMFFEGLGLARDGVLLQPDRALHLLHYLCTGHTPAPEYELTLPKILCNIPLQTPIEADIALTDPEKEEATNLLQAAIRWWTALQGTSPDALRGTFLCRPGKLSRRDDDDWLLQVEYQSFDILLAELPWGISAVKLAWMEEMVWVEWG